ncbi:MAG: M3 family oligoendopeptidase [Eubacteriales bacterium]|nr:M3 family oligoendopeptidase [Eubacteriales bacterium]
MEKFSSIPYRRPDKAKTLRAVAAVAKKAKRAATAADAVASVREYNALMCAMMTQSSLASIRHSIDVNDKFYEAENKFFDDAQPLLMPSVARFSKALIKSPFRAQLEEAFGTHYLAILENTVKKMSFKLILPMQRESALGRAYQKLLASCKVEFQGGVRNLSGLSKFLQDPDREVRKSAFAAISGFLSEHQAELDELYDKLVKLRARMGKSMGYKTYTPLGYINMDRYSYTAEDVKRFREQVVRDLVPVCTMLREKQAKRIGVDTLKIYDESFQFTQGNAAPQGTPEELVKAAQKMYRELSPETGDFFDFMVEYELMDLVTRPSKRVGGYCAALPDYKAPFIFSNFNGTSGDVDVLTHEAGHAFEAVVAAQHIELLELAAPTLESCEIHSMSMEFFTHPWMELFFGENAGKYRYKHLVDSLLFVPYGVCVDEFQHVVYENPGMTPVQRRGAWRELEKKYLPHRDYEGDEFMENGGFWQKQHHIYTAPFYYIDYTLASMSAFEFFGRMREDREKAWADYMALCRAGGTLPYTELLKEAHLSNPFEEGGVKRAIAAAVKAIEETDDMAL